ncbi:hypothetical protein ACN9MF_20300 [Methylobacterium fujisawaense]|uniref:hypothetical protein n=1 Tax=Methylobacterium fujisawaense TaxID=107400 RepID=UPI003CE79422
MEVIDEKRELQKIRMFCIETAIRMFGDDEERSAEMLVSLAADVERYIVTGEKSFELQTEQPQTD